jgi:hypothetical protein
MKKTIRLVTIIITMLLPACSGGGSSNSSSNSQPPGNGGNVESHNENVTISQSSIMPTNGNAYGGFYLSIDNGTPNEISLSNIFATDSYPETSGLNGLQTKLYDATSCNTLQAGQSCLIKVTPIAKEGNFILNTTFKTMQGKTYSTSQTIEYGNIPATNGFNVNSDNLHFAKVDNQNFSVAIPFVLEKTYDNLVINSDVIPISKNVICDLGKYTQGTNCTALLKFKGGNYSNKITLTGNIKSSSKQVAKLPLATASGEATLTISVSDAPLPNIIHNGHKALISNTPRPISILNLGLADETISSITTSDTIQLQTNSCTNTTLRIGTSCSIWLSSNIKNQSNNSQLIFNFANGSNIVMNVFESANNNESSVPVVPPNNDPSLPPPITPGLRLSSNGDFLDTLLGNTKDITIAVTNTSSTASLSNLTFSTLNTPFTLMNSGGANECKTDGTQALSTTGKAGSFCNLILRFAPFSSMNGNLSLSASATYMNSNGQAQSTNTMLLLPYSTNGSPAYLNTVHPQDIYEVPPIIANGIESTEIELLIQNYGSVSATNIKLDDVSFNIDDLANSGAKIQIINNQCSDTLGSYQSCKIKIKMFPTTKTFSMTRGLKISYQSKGDSETKTFSESLKFTASNGALIQSDAAPIVRGATGFHKIDANHYDFIPTLNNKLSITYTYQNNGDMDATLFNILLDGRTPPGFEVVTVGDGHECPIGVATRTLAAGDYCILTLEYIDNNYLQAFGSPDSALIIYQPGYSFVDNGGVSVMSYNYTNSTLINPHSWGKIQVDILPNNSSTGVLLFFTPIWEIIADIAEENITINLPHIAHEWFNASEGKSCTISKNSSMPNCTIELLYVPYMPSTNYYISWQATPQGAGIPLNGIATVTK